jgi:hypothetical protein
LTVVRMTNAAGETFAVYENPIQTQFDNFKAYELRGITDGKTLWLWDSYLGDHIDVAKKLGVHVTGDLEYRIFTLNLLEKRVEDSRAYDYRHDKLPPVYGRLERLLRHTGLK